MLAENFIEYSGLYNERNSRENVGNISKRGKTKCSFLSLNLSLAFKIIPRFYRERPSPSKYKFVEIIRVI